MIALAVYLMALLGQQPRWMRRRWRYGVAFLALLGFLSCVITACSRYDVRTALGPKPIPEEAIGDSLDPIAVPSPAVREAWNAAYQASKRDQHENGGCAILSAVEGRKWYFSAVVDSPKVTRKDPLHLTISCPMGTAPWHTHYKDTVSLTQNGIPDIPVRNFLRCTPSWGEPGTDYGLILTAFPVGVLVCGPNKYVLFAEKRQGGG